MNSALWVSVTGLDAKNTDIRVISNNLANISTAGFKKDRMIFEDLMYQNIRQPGSQSSDSTELPSGLMLGSGVRAVATQKDFSQGSLIKSENGLDLSINGKGFFQVLRPDGQLVYTRDGRFQINSSSQIVTSNGYLLQPGITLPADLIKIDIGSDGIINVIVAGSNTPVQVGQITVNNFTNPAGLQPIGENQYLESAASGSAAAGTAGLNGLGVIQQGFYESSNVNVVEELVRLIETQRGYEMNAKSIETVDGMLRYIAQVL